LAGITEIPVRPGKPPVPVRFATCGLVLAVVTVRVPDTVPRTVGVNVTEIVQLDPAANVLGDSGQVDVCAKAPEVKMPVTLRGTVLRFFKVKVSAALLVFTNWLLNVRAAGEKDTGATPVPFSCIV
jgi:hypothetical protein